MVLIVTDTASSNSGLVRAEPDVDEALHRLVDRTFVGVA